MREAGRLTRAPNGALANRAWFDRDWFAHAAFCGWPASASLLDQRMPGAWAKRTRDDPLVATRWQRMDETDGKMMLRRQLRPGRHICKSFIGRELGG